MTDKILWEYLEELPEQEAAWSEWYRHLSDWHGFSAFHTHYLKVEERRAEMLTCATPCEHGCPRRVNEDFFSDITAVCLRKRAAPLLLKFRDILIYSLRREAFHRALCAALQIKYSGDRWPEYANAWHLGDYYDAARKAYCPVYLTLRTATLSETISLLCRLHHEPFALMMPTGRGLAPDLPAGNNAVLLSLESELKLQPDGSFNFMRDIRNCMTPCSHGRPLMVENSISSRTYAVSV